MSNTLALTSAGLQAYLLVLGLVLFVAWSLLLLRRLFVDPQRCQACGYSMIGLETKRCPECAWEPDSSGWAADLRRLKKYAARCGLITVAFVLLSIGFVFAEPRLPLWGEVIYAGRIEPAGATFEARGSGLLRGPILVGASVPDVDRLDIASGLDQVWLMRDPAKNVWVHADDLSDANDSDIESRLKLAVSARTLDQLLAHHWDRTWPFTAPEIIGSSQAMQQSDHARIDSKNLYNRSGQIVNLAAAAALTLLAAAGVWWVSRYNPWVSKAG